MEILKRIAKVSALLIGLVGPVLATEQIAIDHFGYLNSDEAPAIIDQIEAQDLLNVELSHSGKSIQKRSGYGSYKTLSGSQPIHGGHHFFDSSGNDIQVWGSSTSLWGIVADATPVQLLSSATLNTTWDCADSQGSAYCVDSSRDALIKTAGASMTWYTSPLGTMATITPERLLIAGVAAAPNSIYVSAANNFTNFTTGINAQDSFVEQIASPGSRLTHIEYGCGRWLWWKDQSFGYVLGTDQTNLKIVTVSNQIGTQDNSSATDPDGNVYFRAQDGHIYKYDCTNLVKLTQNITPSIQTSGRRTSNLYIQASQADFQTGTISPTGQLSTTISPGDVMPSSFTATDDIAADWNAGTLTNTVVTAGSVKLNYNAMASVANPSFETGSTLGHTVCDNWTGPDDFGWSQSANGGTPKGTGCPSGFSGTSGNASAIHAATDVGTLTAQLIDISSTVVASASMDLTGSICTGSTITISSSGLLGKRVKVRFKYNSTNYPNSYLYHSNFYILGGDVPVKYYNAINAGLPQPYIDLVSGSGGLSSVTSGSFASRTLDTGITNSYASMTPVYTQSTSAPIFTLQHSVDGTAWANVATSTATSYPVNRYVRYLSSFTPSAAEDANSTLDSMVVVARSSGTYYSPVINKPNLTSWDTLNATILNNNGSHAFYMRGSTNSFTVLSSTPSWTAQTIGAVVSISTSTYFQLRDDFGVTGSTHNPTLSDFTINWFEGSASDKAYATYFDNAIWWALAYGSGVSVNNYVFKYDLILNGWTLFNIPSAGFITQNNSLYFGSPTTSAIYRYGSATSDNGTAINAYWQSKDFPGSDPWLENSYTQMDIFARRNTNSTLTVGYILNASTTSTSFSVSLSSTTDAAIRYKKMLPAGKLGGLINVKFSDTSTTSAWEILGFRVKYDPLPYRPTQ